ncbi:MAG: zf-HC2 domain-containing protein [Balneolales bacterium]|nr:zf-HC2 domain-containing protein [Balneolales bacterium]
MEGKNLQELISAYVDNELSEEEKVYIEDIAKRDISVRKAIQSETRLKQLVRSRMHRTETPAHLKSRINELLSSNVASGSSADSRNASRRQNIQEDRPSASRNRFLFSFAAILVVGLFLYLYQNSEIPQTEKSFATVESVSFEHFYNFRQESVFPVAYGVSEADAQSYLYNYYGCRIVVPELKGATFAGAVYAQFYDDYKIPMLRYRVADDDYVYIFAFEEDKLKNVSNLDADHKARRNIVNHNDVFISKINNKRDVVSWKWDDVWYTAVSDHEGDIIAAMLPH